MFNFIYLYIKIHDVKRRILFYRLGGKCHFWCIFKLIWVGFNILNSVNFQRNIFHIFLYITTFNIDNIASLILFIVTNTETCIIMHILLTSVYILVK